jgi:two-component system, NtrC family, sensor kinase
LDKLQNHTTPFFANWIFDRYAFSFKCSTQSPFIVLHRFVLQFFLFAIWLFFWSLPAQAQNISPDPIEITSEFTERVIGLDLEVYEDKSSELSIEDIISPKYASRFNPSLYANASYGYTNSTWWLRFRLSDTRPTMDQIKAGPLQLTLAYALTDLAEMWCKNAEGLTILHQRSGDHVPLHLWPSTFREPTFEISSSVQSCWMRVQASASLQIPLTLRTSNQFHAHRLQETVLQCLYFGALLVMVAYNGLVAAATRSWAYGFYTLFLIGFGLVQASLSGFGFAILWPNAYFWSDRALPFSISFSGLVSIGFAVILLDIKNTLPRMYKVAKISSMFFAIHLITLWFLPVSMAIRMVLLIMPLWAFFLLGSGILQSWRGLRVAKIFVTAWFLFITGALVKMGINLGWVTSNLLTVNAAQVGSAFEFIMLSFALADRIKTTQANLINAQKKIAEGLRLSEQELTEKVQQRTAALEAAKNQAELSQQQTAQALSELKATQSQLIEAERLASLGQLVGGVAHEINNPIGVIRSNSELIAYNISLTMQKVPLFIHSLQKKELDLFQSILEDSLLNKQFLSSKEERQKKKEIKKELEDLLKENSNQIEMIAEQILILRIKPPYKDLVLGLGEAKFVESLNIAQIFINQSNSIGSIEIAVEKSSRVVFALRNYLNTEMHLQRKKVDLIVEIEKALHVYDNYILGKVSILKEYPNSLEMMCIPENLLQVWKNIIFNAVQAMYLTERRMEIKISKENEIPERILKMKSSHGSEVSILPISDESEWILVSFLDSGMGIPEDLQEKLFSPFFTTKALGEGIGLGLYISKKIIHEHGGRIFFDSKEGSTEFVIGIPLYKNGDTF